jgi:hypothetical protein
LRDAKYAFTMALEPRRYDRILNEAPDDVLGAIFGFLLFEASTAVLVARGLPPTDSARRGSAGMPPVNRRGCPRERSRQPRLRGFGGLDVLGKFVTGRPAGFSLANY